MRDMGDKMYLKIHENQRGKIVAVCDAELIGKVLEEQGRELDLERYRSFYVGEKVGEESVRKALERFGSANIVGKNAIDVVLDMGLADGEDVMYIKKIPYMQIYRL